jgi:hypothetical protein
LVGIALTAVGFMSLLVWIPKLEKQDQIRTDIYAARVSCWAAGTGLAIVSLWTISGILVRSLAILKSIGVLR